MLVCFSFMELLLLLSLLLVMLVDVACKLNHQLTASAQAAHLIAGVHTASPQYLSAGRAQAGSKTK
jgi:hypothetical protein